MKYFLDEEADQYIVQFHSRIQRNITVSTVLDEGGNNSPGLPYAIVSGL